MRNLQGQVIYVGKAASLKKRLSNYYRAADKLDLKTQALTARVTQIELFVTDSETEALVLEYNLIKKYRPRYNIVMRDDKSYPYLKVTIRETFPRLLVTRKPFVDEARYFGPFVGVALKPVVGQLSSTFGLCAKRGKSIEPSKRGCLYYQMKRCTGACMGRVTSQAYGRQVRALLRFLGGEEDRITPRLEQRMRRAARQNNYELAAELRDQLQTLRAVQHQPLLRSSGRETRDVMGLARSGASATVEVLHVLEGVLEERRHVFLRNIGLSSAPELLSQTLTQFYTRPIPIPKDIILSELPEDIAMVAQWLRQRRQAEVRVRTPQTPEERRLLKMAETNAWLNLKHSLPAPEEEIDAKTAEKLDDLVRRLGLERRPLKIEGYDISNLAGQNAVGSQVVFMAGHPAKTSYRRYRIRSTAGPDDYAMLQEVLSRRLQHLTEHKETPPDLILLDGGAGQLSAGMEVLRQLELAHLPVIALAKKNEEIYRPGQSEPLRLDRSSPALKLLTRVRDEAHRFAVDYHRRIRAGSMRASVLDRIGGLGPDRRRELLRAFGSIEGVLNATADELAHVQGIGPVLARRIHVGLRQKANLDESEYDK